MKNYPSSGVRYYFFEFIKIINKIIGKLMGVNTHFLWDLVILSVKLESFVDPWIAFFKVAKRSSPANRKIAPPETVIATSLRISSETASNRFSMITSRFKDVAIIKSIRSF